MGHRAPVRPIGDIERAKREEAIRAEETKHLRKMPSVWQPLGFGALAVFSATTNGIDILTGGGAWDLLWFICAALSLPFWRYMHREILKERKKIREDRFEHWLYKTEWATPRDPDDWAKIERATGALLEKGTEPTYERALDYLRHEEESKKEWYERGQHRHRLSRVLDSERGLVTYSCACGYEEIFDGEARRPLDQQIRRMEEIVSEHQSREQMKEIFDDLVVDQLGKYPTARKNPFGRAFPTDRIRD